jgi:hypothetical protein
MPYMHKNQVVREGGLACQLTCSSIVLLSGNLLPFISQIAASMYCCLASAACLATWEVTECMTPITCWVQDGRFVHKALASAAQQRHVYMNMAGTQSSRNGNSTSKEGNCMCSFGARPPRLCTLLANHPLLVLLAAVPLCQHSSPRLHTCQSPHPDQCQALALAAGQ